MRKSWRPGQEGGLSIGQLTICAQKRVVVVVVVVFVVVFVVVAAAAVVVVVVWSISLPFYRYNKLTKWLKMLDNIVLYYWFISGNTFNKYTDGTSFTFPLIY